MAGPIPANPTNRLRRQEAIRVASLELHLLLRRRPEQVNILDTADDRMPPFVLHGGAAMMMDWQQAAAIRRRLEQIYYGYPGEVTGPTRQKPF
ncbi:hypothetical protein CQ12_40065 [Bradyrhizobium jicamae]|uniref:Uncharacterized protein n=1 Tax=Bradyrhizobium jicamae TaxID=280332 RepID=A0A0R3KRD5_9BRAD|nr:hypothetical protein [Bradyrhizobium jicamae]KRQ95333.1 hypothetical protein CQ12_40065 [Bradyrhizobium jicamae]